MTIEQKFNRCKNNLYLERAKNRMLRNRLQEHEKKEQETKNFINKLVQENSELQVKLVELDYKSKEE